jgi:hypothetical protein
MSETRCQGSGVLFRLGHKPYLFIIKPHPVRGRIRILLGEILRVRELVFVETARDFEMKELCKRPADAVWNLTARAPPGYREVTRLFGNGSANRGLPPPNAVFHEGLIWPSLNGPVAS